VPDITLRVACAQIKARPLYEAKAALQDILSAIRAAKRLRADLVVLPECSYPGYVLLDTNPYARHIPNAQEALGSIAGAAARHSIHVCVGIARPTASGLQNQAVLIDDGGRELGSYSKSYLWSFDSRWFKTGRAQRPLATRFGSIGMMICADGRVPEISRRLAAQNAWLILDPTAWVSYGPTFEAMKNPQADYMLRVRALESGAFIAAADKCGSEHNAVYYVGRSQVVAPDASVVALADTATPTVIVAEVKRPRRRTTFAMPSSAFTVLSHRSSRTASPVVWVGVYQTQRRGARHEKETIQTLQSQRADLIVRTDATPAQLRSALRRCRAMQTACVEGRAMTVPEPARAAARAGTDMLVWLNPPKKLPVLEIARTRALESRMYVLVSTRPRADVSACLIDPEGTVVAAALRDTVSAFFAPLDLAAARRKLVVPGTHIFQTGDG